MSKYIELAKKLNELAKQGIGGEKVNAQKMLDNLIKKHNISIEDIEGTQEYWYIFKIQHSLRKLLFHVAITVNKDISYSKSFTSKIKVKLKCTEAQRIEIEWKYSFYVQAYLKELELFETAFIHKNRLFAEKDENEENEPREENELTAEERARNRKIASMMMFMDKHTPIKQLEK